MRICFVSIDFHTQRSGGGIASYVRAIGDELMARGHKVAVIAKGKRQRWVNISGVDVLFWPLGALHWYWHRLGLPHQVALPLRELEWSFGIRKAMQKLHSRFPIDVAEGCEMGNLLLTGLDLPLVVRLHGERYVFTKYSDESLHAGLRLTRRLELPVLRRAASVTSPSRFQAAEAAQALTWPPGRIHVIPNPIAPFFVEEASDIEVIEEDRQPPLVLYTGRIERRKGTIPLLRSVPEVVRTVPNVRYVIAGGRHASIGERRLNEILDQDSIREAVMLLGHVLWEELVDWYRRASVFVMPSYCETFGISCLEAMAFGLPVVASDATALPEVVEDGVTGILVPSGDSKALAEALTQLLENPDLRRRMGQAGRERVLARFTVDRVADQTLRVYREALSEG